MSKFAATTWPSTNRIRVGMVANFAPFKRHEDFLRMAAEMLKVRSDLEFVVVGDDISGTNNRPRLEELAAQLGLGTHLAFLGHREDVPAIMRQLHLLVAPSQFEPFGRVVIEAMASGRPVVGSRDGGIAEIIEDGQTGYLVDVGDFEGFARAALRIVSDRTTWERMSAASVARVSEHFSERAHARRIVDVYRAVLAA